MRAQIQPPASPSAGDLPAAANVTRPKPTRSIPVCMYLEDNYGSIRSVLLTRSRAVVRGCFVSPLCLVVFDPSTVYSAGNGEGAVVSPAATASRFSSFQLKAAIAVSMILLVRPPTAPAASSSAAADQFVASVAASSSSTVCLRIIRHLDSMHD